MASVRSACLVPTVETLLRHVALVLNDGAVGTLEVPEAGAVCGLNALGLRVRNLCLGTAKRAAETGPRVAADEYRTALVGGIERQKADLRALLEPGETLVHVDDIPAEMPDRGLGLGGRRGVHLGEHHQCVSGLKGRQTGKAGFDGTRKLAHVKIDGGVRIDRVQVKVMEAGRGERYLGSRARAKQQRNRKRAELQ